MLSTDQIYDLEKAREIIPRTRIIIQEFVSLIANIKPIILCELNPEEKIMIEKNFPKIFIDCRKVIINNRKIYNCILSTNKSYVEQTIRSLYVGNTTVASQTSLGLLLGYPKCCIDNWLKYFNKEDKYDFNRITYDAYKSSKECNGYTNNLFNFSTRVYSNNSKKFYKYISLNGNSSVSFYNYQYISHIPCKYDCKKSIAISMKIKKILQNYDPNIEKDLKTTLFKPILFFDIFDMVVFDGYVDNGILIYDKVIQPFFPIESSLLKIINQCNKIIVNDRTVMFQQNNKVIFTYDKKNEADGFILNFKP